MITTEHLPVALIAALVALTLTAAAYDYRFRKIPNWLNLSGLITGFGLNLYFFHSAGAARAAEGMALAIAVYLPFYLLRGMGAGDVKLMAAIGCLVGPSNWFVIFVITALAGGITGVIFSLLKRRLTETCINVSFILKDLLQFRTPYSTNPQLDFRNQNSLRLPHGISIAIGSAVFLLASTVRV